MKTQIYSKPVPSTGPTTWYINEKYGYINGTWCSQCFEKDGRLHNDETYEVTDDTNDLKCCDCGRDASNEPKQSKEIDS